VNGSQRPRAVSEALLAGLGSRLTERDRQIALDCYEHRVLTTEQLTRLYFTGARTARARLHTLYTLRVLDRFRPPWQRGDGSTPHHWTLDEAGAHLVAAEQGIDRRQLRWRHASALSIATSIMLTHQVEVNELFARLALEASAAGGSLTEWYGERSTRSMFAGLVTPDGYGVLTLPGLPSTHLLLELDRGTEPAERLREKAERYTQAIPRSTLRHSKPAILLAVPTHARARTAAAAVGDANAPITVAVWSAASTQSTLAIVTDAGSESDKRASRLSRQGP
jgi:hypothetical protein